MSSTFDIAPGLPVSPVDARPGLPEMPSARVDVRAAKALGDQAEVLLRKATMRCGGCLGLQSMRA